MGQYLIIEDFRRGLDPRKLSLGAPAGTLVELNNGHITNAGDIEKRKALVEFSDLSTVLDDNGDQGLFGLQETATGLTVFGSAGVNGSAPLYGQPELAGSIAVTNPVVSYQKLTHPAVLEGITYDRTKHRMAAVVWSELFGGTIQAVAEFADGRSFLYSDGSLVEDGAAGLVLAHLANDNPRLATHLKRLVGLSADYTAVQTVLTTTTRSRAANVATLGTSSTTGLSIGSKVRVSGVTNLVTGDYNAGGAVVTLTNVTANSVSYANNGTNEGSLADVGGSVTTSLVTITGALGVEFDPAVTKDTAAGTIGGPTNTVSAVQAVAGASARGSFTLMGGSADGVAATAATGTITRTATNASNGDVVRIGTKRYTFKNTLTTEGDVKIAASAADSLTNLMRAINRSGTPGTDYLCARAHPWVRAGNISGLNLPLTAFKGSQGSSISLGENTSSARYVVSGATMTGGAGNCIGSIKVEKNGTETELLNDAVLFATDVNVTAKAVRDAIVAFSGTSGYTAEVNGATVTVLSSTGAAPMPNGYHVQVASGGNVLVGSCQFYLTQKAATFTINTIIVEGLDCLGTPLVFPTPPVDTLPEYYEELVRVINTRSGITGINAWTDQQSVRLSRLSTRDDDAPVTVYITPSTPANPDVGIVFSEPPPLALPLSVALPARVDAPGTEGTFPGSGTATVPKVSFSVVVTPVITGGNGSLTYAWLEEYPALAAGNVWADRSNSPNAVQLPYAIEVTPANARVPNVTLTISGPAFQPGNYDVHAVSVKFYVRLRVTDSFGNTALSEVCELVWQIV